jgi:hypothetical protein
VCSEVRCVLLVGCQCPESVDRKLQLWNVALDGRLEDGVRRVEVPVRESVAHAGDSGPTESRPHWRGTHEGRTFDSFADFAEPHSHSIEDQVVCESVARHVAPDGVDRGREVLESLQFVTGHSATWVSRTAPPHTWLEAITRDEIDGTPRISSNSRCSLASVNRPFLSAWTRYP